MMVRVGSGTDDLDLSSSVERIVFEWFCTRKALVTTRIVIVVVAISTRIRGLLAILRLDHDDAGVV